MKQRQGINNSRLKNRNRGLVLQAIACGDEVSRSDIAQRIGLTKMAVTNMVAEWIAEGVVEEQESTGHAAVGRNPVWLRPAPGAPRALGVYLSRSRVTLIVADLKLEVAYRKDCPLQEETAASLTQKLTQLVDDALAWKTAHLPDVPLTGIGISSIGPLDADAGVVLHPTDFFGIQQFPIVKILKDRYGLPVYISNDMNASALAEKLYGRGRSYDNFLYLGITNGIGSGIISGGRLYQDNSGFVGEVGHMSIDYNGPVCSCGNRGCLEVYANMPVIQRRLREAGIAALSQADGSAAGRDILADVSDKLAIALVNMVNLLDPQCVLMGHEGSAFPDWCLQRIEETVNSRILAAGAKRLPVMRAAFGEDTPLMGSVCCIWQELFAGHMPHKP